MARFGLLLLLALCISACDIRPLNFPYQSDDSTQSIMYSSFSLRPKHLDPARSYSSNEAIFTGQIYEPPLQYHYLKRPYELTTLTAESMPKVSFYDRNNQLLPNNAPVTDLAYSLYEISIKPNIYYQPHPAFVRDKERYSYHQLTQEQLADIEGLADFELTSTRELIAADYVYQIKRLAHPKIHSPILGVMSAHIVGLTEYAEQLQALQASDRPINLQAHEIDGVKVIDRYTYQIKVHGKYPQLNYWLAMPFFAPMPWEAEAFYSQPSLVKKNIVLDWYPVGTGPYYLTHNDPNRQMVLERNPNFRGEPYPSEGEVSDQQAGLLNAKGQQMPFIDKVIYTLEKENTSYWNKFLQGYYDISGISSDSFEQAIQVGATGEFGLSEAMKEKGMALKTAVATTTIYMGFNMIDPIIGGNSERARKLRQAISIALDYEEYISIFANGRGIAAQSLIPPGIFGYFANEEGINPVVYEWKDGQAKRKSLAIAKQLLREAGYPEGRDQKTGQPLSLYFDVTGSGPDDKARLNWLRKQFNKLGIQLVIRNTDYNRFQEKIRKGTAQIFQWGWNADYPDPENFLFLLYGPNSKVKFGGENAVNYSNDEFDRLFERMRVMENNEERMMIIKSMLSLLHHDAPWAWGFHPKQFSLYHSWNQNVKPNLMANNILKYRKLDIVERANKQEEWNQPLLWPLGIILFSLFVLLLPAVMLYRKKVRAKIQF